MDISWEDPPEHSGRGRGGGRLRAFVTELEKHPGKWALWRDDATSASTGSGYRKQYPQCQWTTRKTAPGMWSIYARYIPPELGDY